MIEPAFLPFLNRNRSIVPPRAYAYRGVAALFALIFSACSLAPFKSTPLTTESLSRLVISDAGIGTFTTSVGDWNHDGWLDLVVMSAEEGKVTTYLNRGRRRFEKIATISTGDVPRGAGVGDFNGDGNLDLSVAHAVSSDVALLLGDGSGRFTPVHKRLKTGLAPFYAPLVDVDRDAKLDIVIVNESNAETIMHGTVSLMWGDGHGGFAERTDLLAGKNPSYATVGDVNGDGLQDVVVSNWGSDNLSVFLNRDGRHFAEAREVAYAGGRPYGMALLDFNGDRKLDVALTSLDPYAVFVMFGDGNGGFVTDAQYPVGRGVRDVSAADVDADGINDLITANTSADSVSVLYGRAGGKFEKGPDIEVGKGPRTVGVADLDHHGRLDLIVSNQSGSNVYLLFQ